MRPARITPTSVAFFAFASLALVLLGAGCATTPLQVTPPAVATAVPNLSPIAEEVSVADAWRLAETFAAARPHREVLIGRGGSMLPLYRDRTVLVVETMELGALRPGMTVVFLGEEGEAIAHTLVAKTAAGWIAKGLANSEVDPTPICFENYVGTVVKAFMPNPRIAARPHSFDPDDRLVAETAATAVPAALE